MTLRESGIDVGGDSFRALSLPPATYSLRPLGPSSASIRVICGLPRSLVYPPQINTDGHRIFFVGSTNEFDAENEIDRPLEAPIENHRAENLRAKTKPVSIPVQMTAKVPLKSRQGV
jgi:hypothetical protein